MCTHKKSLPSLLATARERATPKVLKGVSFGCSILIAMAIPTDESGFIHVLRLMTLLQKKKSNLQILRNPEKDYCGDKARLTNRQGGFMVLLCMCRQGTVSWTHTETRERNTHQKSCANVVLKETKMVNPVLAVLIAPPQRYILLVSGVTHL